MELETNLQRRNHSETDTGVAAGWLDEDAGPWDEFALLFGDVDHALGHTVFDRAADVHELDFAIYVARALSKEALSQTQGSETHIDCI